MKRLLSFILILFVSVNLCSCACSCNKKNVQESSTSNSEKDNKATDNKATDNKATTDDRATTDDSESKIPEPDWSKAEETEIYGKIEKGMYDMLVISEKWDTRSKVSYYVFGEKVSQLQDKMGQFAKVKGLTPKRKDRLGEWRRRIYVKEILEITKKPAE